MEICELEQEYSSEFLALFGKEKRNYPKIETRLKWKKKIYKKFLYQLVSVVCPQCECKCLCVFCVCASVCGFVSVCVRDKRRQTP